MQLTPNQLHILQHSLGCDQYGRGQQYRNHYADHAQSKDWLDLHILVAAGFMEDRGKPAAWGTLTCFVVTDAGKRVMIEQSPPPPKVSRSRSRWLEWLDSADAYYPMKFGEWLRRKLYKDEVSRRYWQGRSI